MDAPCFIKEHLWMGLLMKQHSNFSRENDKHSHKGGDFLPQKDFLCLLIYYNARVGEYNIFFAVKIFLFACLHVFTS